MLWWCKPTVLDSPIKFQVFESRRGRKKPHGGQMVFGEVSGPSHDGRSYNGKAYSMMLHVP